MTLPTTTEALRELQLYNDTEEARAARALLRALTRVLDLDEKANADVH